MITLNNYEEYLIDYLHGELDETTATEVESFLSRHEDVRHEFDLLGQTIVTPDADIVFTDKQLLLQPVSRPFFIKYKAQFAAAAMLTGIILGILFLYHPAEVATDSLVKVSNPNKNNVVPPSETATPAEADAHNATAAVQEDKKEAPVKRKGVQTSPMAKKTDDMNNGQQATKEPENIVKQKEYEPVDLKKEEMPLVKTKEGDANIIEKRMPAVEPGNETALVAKLPAEKNNFELNKQKQPKLFRAIAQVVRLSRKIKDKKETLANTEITVIVGNKKIINLN